VLHQLTSNSSSILLHERLGQATYFAFNSGYVVWGLFEEGAIRASDHVCLVAVMSYLDASVSSGIQNGFQTRWTVSYLMDKLCVLGIVFVLHLVYVHIMNDTAFSYIYLMRCWKRLLNSYLFSIVNSYSCEILSKALKSRNKMCNVDFVNSAWSVASRTVTIASKTVTRHTTVVVLLYCIVWPGT
jgi:hypothetical protein